MDSLRRSWEQRAIESGSQLSAVLFRGLSEQSNAVIDDWHSWLVKEIFLPRVARDGRILDIGCGYGRLSMVMARERPDLMLMGQDITFQYCRQFRQTTGACVQADAKQPPFVDNHFDGILAVTCLMYTPREHVRTVLKGWHSLLRPGGFILLLDPGLELQRWIAGLRGTKVSAPTGGQGFSRKEYCGLVEDARFVISDRGGNPWMSTALLIPGVAKSSGRRIRGVLDRLVQRNHVAGGYSAFAPHRRLLAQRPFDGRSAST